MCDFLYPECSFYHHGGLKICTNSLTLLPLGDGVRFPSVESGLDYNYFDQECTGEAILCQLWH